MILTITTKYKAALRSERDRYKEALHLISLGSQNSMSNRNELGKIARTALEGK